jgi:RNA polymerase sigma factor (sigma-70 family)
VTPKCSFDWPPFVAEYLPVVRGWARGRFRLGDADADDAAQEVMLSIFCYGHSFDPAKGSLRAWVFQVTRRRCSDMARRNARRNAAGLCGETMALDLFAAPEPPDALVRAEDRLALARVLAAAEGAVSPKAWAAFRGSAVEERPAGEVAAELGTTVGSVYVMTHRVKLAAQAIATEAA